MSGRITILCENTAGPITGTMGEHGFAALVEWGGEALLFDTGQGLTLLHNAQRMNRDLRQVERVVLSHGHYDHTGGLWPLLRSCGRKEILAHPGVFARRYVLRDDGSSYSAGIPYSEEFLAGQGASFSLSGDFREIGPGMFLTGEVPRTTAYETGDTGLCCDDAGCTADPIRDDQSLLLKTGRGLVLLLGCCHAGVVNTIEWAMEKTGVSDIHAVIGGTHLGFCSPEQLEHTVAALRGYGIRRILGSHCTGFAGAARLLREFPGHYHPAQVGYTLEL